MTYKRIEKYKGRIIVQNGNCFMTFWSNKRFNTIEEARAAIDDGSAFDGRG